MQRGMRGGRAQKYRHPASAAPFCLEISGGSAGGSCGVCGVDKPVLACSGRCHRAGSPVPVSIGAVVCQTNGPKPDVSLVGVALPGAITPFGCVKSSPAPMFIRVIRKIFVNRQGKTGDHALPSGQTPCIWPPLKSTGGVAAFGGEIPERPPVGANSGHFSLPRLNRKGIRQWLYPSSHCASSLKQAFTSVTRHTAGIPAWPAISMARATASIFWI